MMNHSNSGSTIWRRPTTQGTSMQQGKSHNASQIMNCSTNNQEHSEDVPLLSDKSRRGVSEEQNFLNLVVEGIRSMTFDHLEWLRGSKCGVNVRPGCALTLKNLSGFTCFNCQFTFMKLQLSLLNFELKVIQSPLCPCQRSPLYTF